MPRAISLLRIIVAALLCAAGPAYGAFGLTTATDSYTVDTNAGLVFKVRRTDNGSSTQSAGDLMSLVYNGVEYQNQSRGSHINSGFDFLYPGISAVNVSAAVVNADFIRITVTAGDLTHYYLARNGQPHIYMATYFTSQPDAAGGLCRYIVRIPAAKLPNGPVPSDIRGNTGAIESGDIFGMADGTTRSKHYSNMRLKDWSHIGATGPGVGVWMIRGNHEGDSGGPFYRSLLNQCGDDQEITYILNYGQVQTEAFRSHILNGPYVLAFNGGNTPATPDTSWVADMALTGFVGSAGRGTVSASAITGRDTDHAYTVGFANPQAQYWADAASANGAFTCGGMLPGTYTMKVYKNELAVHSADVTVNAGATTALGTLAITADPSATSPRWRIGTWDGSPGEFLNGDKVTTMHPSDVRMASWNPGPYVIGSSTPATGIPCYQWKDINGTQQVNFQLTSQQLVASTLRIGLTVAYSGARPNVTVNSWTSTFQNPSSQPSTRSLTTGSYRGNNVTYTFAIPASALVAGTNTLWISPISGSGASGFLSAGYSLDCIDFFQGTAQTVALPPAPASLSATASPGQVRLDWPAAAGATGYSVRRATVSGGPYIAIATAVSGTTFTDTGVTNGTTYYYVVSGSNSSGAGLPSPEAISTAGGLIAFYPLDGDALDRSGNANHGTANAVTYATESGAQAGEFNGTSSHVVIPRSVQDDFTVSLWVKTTATGGTGSQWWSGKGLVDGEVSGTAADWGMSVLNGKLAFGVGGADTTFSSTSTINDGQWHHLAATRRSGTGAIALYVDGAPQSTGTGPTGARTAPPVLRIGSIQTGAASGFHGGGIDNVGLHNRALSAAEITAIFDAGRLLPAAPAGLGATAISASRIDLSWLASAGATSYTVKRSTVSGGPYTTVASGFAGTTFSDTGLTQGTTYHYVVSAANAGGPGANSAEAAATPVPPPARAHLRFDELAGTTAADASGNGWNGNLVNGAAFAAGRINRAVALDGTDDHVGLPAGVVAGLGDFTIATWVKWNGGSNWQRAFDFGTGTTNYLFFTPKASVGPARFAIRTPAVAEQILEGPALAIGQWTHVAVTLSGTTGTLYLNGVAAETKNTITLTPAHLGSTTQNHLGKSQFTADATLNGTLDDFQIHARALGAAEISALANPPAAPSGLLAVPGNGQVSLGWNAVPGANGYRVFRSTSPGGPYAVIASNVSSPAFTDTGVTNGTTYHYVVATIFSVAESAHSAVASATPAVPPTTVARWDFEDGIAGQAFTPVGSPNGSGGSVDTQSGILMRGWDPSGGASWTAAAPPNGGSLAMSAADNHQDGYVSEGALHGWSPTAWTIECTVYLEEMAGYKTLIGRDGSSQGEAESDFYLQNEGVNDHFRVNLDTVGGARWIVEGGYTVQANTWYALAVRSDGSELSLWLDDGSGYQKIGSRDITAQSVAANALPGSNLAWTFGRGWFDGGFVDHIDGRMDNIRFSSAALAPQDFIPLVLTPPAPAGLAATAMSASQIGLSWAASPGATSYNVKRSTSSGGPFGTIVSGMAATTFNDTGLAPGVTYHYVVSAENVNGESADSTGDSATTWSPEQEWRFVHFGTIDNSGEAADSADPDKDGTRNGTERRLGLDPNDGSAAFKATATPVPAGFQISWPAAPGLTFEIRRDTTLDGPGDLIGTVTGEGIYTDPNPPAGKAFYRIVLLP